MRVMALFGTRAVALAVTLAAPLQSAAAQALADPTDR